MTYQKLPLLTTLSSDQFIEELNKALPVVEGYRVGMFVKADDSGYWLDYNGESVDDHPIILSAARKLVLG